MCYCFQFKPFKFKAERVEKAGRMVGTIAKPCTVHIIQTEREKERNNVHKTDTSNECPLD